MPGPSAPALPQAGAVLPPDLHMPAVVFPAGVAGFDECADYVVVGAVFAGAVAPGVHAAVPAGAWPGTGAMCPGVAWSTEVPTGTSP